jgi:hypothetical protein
MILSIFYGRLLKFGKSLKCKINIINEYMASKICGQCKAFNNYTRTIMARSLYLLPFSMRYGSMVEQVCFE